MQGQQGAGVLVKPERVARSVSNPGRVGVGHQWAYLPDVARTMVALLARPDPLDAFATFHFGGHWDVGGSQMAQAICCVVARRSGKTPSIAAFPWWLMRLADPFVETLRELQEMRYLW